MIINMNGAKAPETPSPVLQEKTVTPETLPVVIGTDEGYDGLSQVTVNPDAQLKAENIRSGKTIFGVAGTFIGGESSSQLLKAIAGYMSSDGTYVEELRTSTFPEDIGYPNINPVNTIRFLELGVCVKTLYVDVPLKNRVYLYGSFLRGTSSNITSPAKVICTETDSAYYSDTTLDGNILGLPEIPSGGNDKFLASKVNGTIVTDGELVIDDTHWFNNASYCGYYYCHLRTLNADGTTGSTPADPPTIHFKRNVSTLRTGTLSFYSGYNVRFYSDTPPTLEQEVFNTNLRKLIVPKGLLETYQNTSGWNSYASKIVEADQ